MTYFSAGAWCHNQTAMGSHMSFLKKTPEHGPRGPCLLFLKKKTNSVPQWLTFNLFWVVAFPSKKDEPNKVKAFFWFLETERLSRGNLFVPSSCLSNLGLAEVARPPRRPRRGSRLGFGGFRVLFRTLGKTIETVG